MDRKISEYEAFCLITVMLVAKVFYSYIKTLSAKGGPAAWQMALVALLTAALLFWGVAALAERFPGMGMVEIFRLVLGKWLGTVVLVLLVGYWLYFCGIRLRETGELLKSYQMDFAEMNLILIGLLVAVLALMRSGLLCVCRVAATCLWVVLGGLIILLVLSLRQYDVVNLLPFWGRGLTATLRSGVMHASVLDDLFLLLAMADCMENPKMLKKAGFKSLAVGGGLTVLAALCYCMAFQYNIAQLQMSPLLEMVRRIYFSRFFERFEAIYLFIFVLSMLVDVGGYACVATRVYCRLFGIKRFTITVLPFVFIILSVALMPESFTTMLAVHLRIIREFSGLWQFGLPLLVLAVAALRRKRGGDGREKLA